MAFTFCFTNGRRTTHGGPSLSLDYASSAKALLLSIFSSFHIVLLPLLPARTPFPAVETYSAARLQGPSFSSQKLKFSSIPTTQPLRIPSSHDTLTHNSPSQISSCNLNPSLISTRTAPSTWTIYHWNSSSASAAISRRKISNR